MHIFFKSDPKPYKLFRIALEPLNNEPLPNIWVMSAAIERSFSNAK